MRKGECGNVEKEVGCEAVGPRCPHGALQALVDNHLGAVPPPHSQKLCTLSGAPRSGADALQLPASSPIRRGGLLWSLVYKDLKESSAHEGSHSFPEGVFLPPCFVFCLPCDCNYSVFHPSNPSLDPQLLEAPSQQH